MVKRATPRSSPENRERTAVERAVALVDQDPDGIRITAVVDGVTFRTPLSLLSPDLARERLVAVLPWMAEPIGGR